jgi:hypothetical protein
MAQKLRGIEEKLDIEAPDEFEYEELDIVFGNEDEDRISDYMFIRKRLLNAINLGDMILKESLKELKSAPTPRMTEASSTILKTIVDSSKELFNIHEKYRKINHEANSSKGGGTEEGEEGKVKAQLSEILKSIEK